METINQKKLLAKLLIPKDAKIDWTNLGATLVPPIEMPHWKHNKIHAIVRGIHPLDQVNELPKECKLEFKDANNLRTSCPEVKHFLPSVMVNSNDSKVNQILNTDFKVQHLLSGDLGKYASPSEARLALYCTLAAYGLTDDQVFSIMSMSNGLNYHEKAWLQVPELEKARKFVTKQRQVYGDFKQ